MLRCLAPVVGVLVANASGFAASDRAETVQTRTLLIAGEDAGSVLYVARLARMGEALWADAFGPVPDEAPAAVVKLVERHRADGLLAARFLTVSGRSTVEVAWVTDLQRWELSQALAVGWWRRASLFSTGSPEHPAWLASAAAAQLEARLNPLFRDRLLVGSGAETAPRLETVLVPVQGDNAPGHPEWSGALILAKSLTSVLGAFPDPAGRLAAWVETQTPEHVSEWWRQAADTPALRTDVEAAWQALWAAAREESGGPHWGSERSARELQVLAGRFRQMQEGGEDPGALAKHTLADVRRALARIHPVYHNALLTLGTTLEVMVAEARFDEPAALEAFFRELDQAETTALEMRRLLDGTRSGPAGRGPPGND